MINIGKYPSPAARRRSYIVAARSTRSENNRGIDTDRQAAAETKFTTEEPTNPVRIWFQFMPDQKGMHSFPKKRKWCSDSFSSTEELGATSDLSRLIKV